MPIISYSQEAGNVFGLAKFNAFRLNINDTISVYSKLSEVFTISTKGNVNLSVSTNLSFSENKWMVLGYINYKKNPEYILGIGNDVKREDAELITINRVKFVNYILRNVTSHFYLGTGVDLTNTFAVEKDSTSFLLENDITGKDGAFTLGLGVASAWDSRDNRYNAHNGSYIFISYLYYTQVSDEIKDFHTWLLDVRHYFTPWKKHVIALQLATNFSSGDVPFYELSKLGGEERMRGYYNGALRDKVLLDGQIEYRMPVWKIFGIAGWLGYGRVANNYRNLSLDGFRPSYGLGFRIKVDSESDINLRMDFGKGIKGVSGFYINFAEAF
ncbi:MAG: BamA/TamA family outer membrane protein [Marinilabiliaceae bacterium]|nr:BamA/TamA family outer membrane protein [Marinilabiliaceae bacterium]